MQLYFLKYLLIFLKINENTLNIIQSSQIK